MVTQAPCLGAGLFAFVYILFEKMASALDQLTGIIAHGVLLLLAVGFAFETAALADRGPVRSLLELRQERVVVQKWDLSCGAAAIATLLNYQHGDTIPEREIARSLIQRKEYIDKPMLVRVQQGFSLLDLKRYVDGRGYEGIGYGRLTLADLAERAPILVPVNFYGYNHFVVFRGIRGNRVLLADPAWGNRTLSVRRFEEAWLMYPKFGKVGFEVVGPEVSHQVNRLAPSTKDFVMLR